MKNDEKSTSPILFNLLVVSLFLITQIESQVTIAKNTQVTPRCGSQLISIEINFDPTQLPGGKFHDWIVVGVSGRSECRLRGNGETKYIVEIAVFNDPCLTQIPAQNVFQNRVRIGKNPVVILEGDQSITVKCVYGLPTVETLAMPVINPNFNIDNLAHAGVSETSLTSAQTNSFSSDNNNFNTQNQNQNQFLIPQITSEQPQGEANIIPNGMSSTDEEINNQPSTNSFAGINGGGSEPSSVQQQQQQFTSNPIRPQIPIRLGNEDLQLHTALPPDSFIPRQQATNSFENGDFSVNATASKRRSSFSIVFLLAIIFAVIIVLLCLICLLFFLRKRRDERNRRLLIDGVSSADESKRTGSGSHARWTDASTDGYASPGTAQEDLNSRPGRSAISMFDKRNTRVAESREVPIPVVSVRKNRSDGAAHYSKAGANRHNSTSSAKESKKSPAPLAPKKHFPPLKSNLEEFVSKTYAMGEYNDLTSPAYAYTSEVYDEREVDIGFGTNKSQKIKRRPRADEERLARDESAVSSYRSITEIVHAAETTNITPSTVATTSSTRESEENDEMGKLLIDAVVSIRGFGYRKLTEQEMGRWKNLIHRDKYLRDLLISSKSVAEIEDIFEGDDYKNMFSSTKWHEIAQCVHRALTSSLDRTNSQSQLQLFVGNVHSDW